MHFGAGGDALAELGEVVGTEEVGAAVRVGADTLRELGGERVDDPEGEVGAGEVVRQERVAGRLPGLVGDLPVEDQVTVVVRDDHRGAGLGELLPVAHGEREGVHHGLGALDGGGVRGVLGGGVHTGEQLTERREQHTGLAERGQDLPDVAEEGGVRADDEHGPLGEELALLVQEERRPVQRHRGLARAGTALHHEHAAVRVPDDPVLLGLDGLHDVAHAAGAGRVQGGEQHRVAGRVLEPGALLVTQVEDLVVQLGDGAALGGEVAAPPDAHGRVPGGEIEGAGDRRAPVDQNRGVLAVVLANSDAPDVMRGAACLFGEIDPAEAQRTVDRVQRREQAGTLDDEEIPFEPRLLAGADRRQGVRDRLRGIAAQHIDARVKPVDEFLLFLQFSDFTRFTG